jgi:dTDP-4-dehydrorhamnose 3,5-epimerase
MVNKSEMLSQAGGTFGMSVPDAYTLTSAPFRDHRGSVDATWENSVFVQIGLSFSPVSNVFSYTKSRNTLRGLHYQHEPYSQAKLVTCVSGRVWDVLVDLRQASSTYLSWSAQELGGDSGRSLLIPRGCAHGFVALTDDVVMAYLIEGEYHPSSASVIRWDDPLIGIHWPCSTPILSDTDRLAKDYLV